MFGLMTTNKNKASKEIALIGDNVKKINGDAKKLGMALNTLNNNVALIKKTVNEIENANFDKHNEFIDALELDDEYKAGLKKEIEATRDEALVTLAPIQEASEKIRGNMVASMVKYQMMVRTLGIQKNVIESGTVQVEAINNAQELGAMSTDKIKELVEKAEEINKMTKTAVSDWSSGIEDIKATLKSTGNADQFNVFEVK